MRELVQMGNRLNVILTGAIESSEQYGIDTVEKLGELTTRSRRLQEEFSLFKENIVSGRTVSILDLEKIKKDMQQILLDTLNVV